MKPEENKPEEKQEKKKEEKKEETRPEEKKDETRQEAKTAEPGQETDWTAANSTVYTEIQDYDTPLAGPATVLKIRSINPDGKAELEKLAGTVK